VIVPAFPTAQPLFTSKIARPFRVSVVDADDLICPADHGRSTMSNNPSETKPNEIARKSL
jgi:hypothetical protein